MGGGEIEIIHNIPSPFTQKQQIGSTTDLAMLMALLFCQLKASRTLPPFARPISRESRAMAIGWSIVQ